MRERVKHMAEAFMCVCVQIMHNDICFALVSRVPVNKYSLRAMPGVVPLPDEDKDKEKNTVSYTHTHTHRHTHALVPSSHTGLGDSVGPPTSGHVRFLAAHSLVSKRLTGPGCTPFGQENTCAADA